MSNYTHLHLHSEYSLLDGVNKISTLVKKAKELNMSAMALSDHGNLFGAIDFYKTMKAGGIKPIIGMEAYVHNGETIDDKSYKGRYHLCLFAKDYEGYLNLMYLSSISYMEGFYYFPRIDKHTLKKYSKGLIATSACLNGEVNFHLNTKKEKNIRLGAGGYNRAKEVALGYKDIFGDDFYLEIMRHGIDQQRFIDDDIIKISLETGIKLVATNDAHYGESKDSRTQEIMMCIGMNKLYNDPKRLKHDVSEFYIKSYDEMSEIFSDIPDALDRTMEIADKCNLELKLGEPVPPSFKFTKKYSTRDGVPTTDDTEYFKYRCSEGLKERLKFIDSTLHQNYYDRLKLEIDVISGMNFSGYMLIVWDFIKYAIDEKIPVGPGRGSAAGSLVAYVLNITDVDPIKHDLLFERFLNKERVSMPDIDIDFAQASRSRVIEYVIKSYGKNRVAQVITFGSLLARGAIRDVARVFDYPLGKADYMAKLIPDDLGITLDKAKLKEPKIRELINSDNDAKEVWEYAVAVEGLKRNTGMHAAGIVISNSDLWKKTPIYRPPGEENYITQYSLNFLEDVDLIKFDFLGLKTLDVISNTLLLIEKNYSKSINWQEIDMNDPKVYETVISGNTMGLFQIESDGMQRLNKKLQPSSFNDIVAVLALYRPGPMESGMLDDFIERKHGRSEIAYLFDELEPILRPTYGVIVYQEQVMQIVQVVGGFSLGEADIIRRVMGKKKKDEMDRYRLIFADGAVAKGFNREKSIELFNLIEKFAGYGFNKSHSAAYAMITFQTAYLKTYYTAEFMASLLTSEIDNNSKVAKYIDEIKRLNISLIPPNINSGSYIFDTEILEDKKSIVFGLGAIKGIGSSISECLNEITNNGRFTSLNDFINRTNSSQINKRVLESLSKIGALSDFGYSRKALVNNHDQILSAIQNSTKMKDSISTSLFSDDKDVVNINLNISDEPEYELSDILSIEYDLVELYISGHPLDDYRDKIEKLDYTLSSELDLISDGTILIVGKIMDKVSKISKKGNKFLSIKILDFHGYIDLMIFSDKLIDKINNLDLTLPLVFKVNIKKGAQFLNIMLNSLYTLDESISKRLKVSKILVNDNKDISIQKDSKVVDDDITKDTSKVLDDKIIVNDVKNSNIELVQITIDLLFDYSPILEYIKNIAIKNIGNSSLDIIIKDYDGSSVKIVSKYKLNSDAIRELKNSSIKYNYLISEKISS